MGIDAIDPAVQIGQLRRQPRVEFDHLQRVGGDVVEKLHVEVAVVETHRLEEAGRHVEALFNKFLRLPFQMLFPPGYLSAKSLKNMLTHKRSVAGQEHTVDTLIEQGIILCGSPDTVRKRLMDSHRLLGFQNFLALLQFATLPRDLTEKNIRLFASEVMPALQSLTDKEYAGMRTQAAE